MVTIAVKSVVSLLVAFIGLLSAAPPAARHIVALRTREVVEGKLEYVNATEAVLANRSAPIARPLILYILFLDGCKPQPDDPVDQDIVVLLDGRRSFGYVRSVTEDVMQPGARWKLPSVACIWFAAGRPGAWTVYASRSGGFVSILKFGRASTEGYANVADRAKAQPGLATEKLQRIEDAIRAVDPTKWRSSYVPAGDNGCCDRFHMSLLLQLCLPDGTWLLYSTSWYSGNGVSPDLSRLYAAVASDDSTPRLTQR
jgi:hypothetical protein